MNTLFGVFICSDRTRGEGFKLTKGRFRLENKEQFSTLWLVRYWSMLSRKAMDAPYLAVFKTRLDGALSNLVSWWMLLPTAGGWNKMSFKMIPSNTNHSMVP